MQTVDKSFIEIAECFILGGVVKKIPKIISKNLTSLFNFYTLKTSSNKTLPSKSKKIKVVAINSLVSEIAVTIH